MQDDLRTLNQSWADMVMEETNADISKSDDISQLKEPEVEFEIALSKSQKIGMRQKNGKNIQVNVQQTRVRPGGPKNLA